MRQFYLNAIRHARDADQLWRVLECARRAACLDDHDYMLVLMHTREAKCLHHT